MKPWDKITSIAVLGEVMLELTPAQNCDFTDHLRCATAGDTYNTAVPIAQTQIDTYYVTGLGDDSSSDLIRADMQRWGLKSDFVETLNATPPGLYMIQNDADGERHFTYWRDGSAARKLFSGADALSALLPKLLAIDAIFVSGITLAIASVESRTVLFEFLSQYRAQGGLVIFDSNYRPRLWSSPELAAQALEGMLQQTDVFLPSIEDLQQLWSGDDNALLHRIQSYQHISEVVLKNGGGVLQLFFPSTTSRKVISITLSQVDKVIDTTGAGDSFNGGYLVARLAGYSAEESVQRAHKLASTVIQHKGAILPLEVMKPILLV